MFDSARAKERLTLLELTISGTSSGQVLEDYVTVSSFCGSILNQRGNNTFDDGNRYSDNISFYCRYNRNLKTPFEKKQYRLSYNGSTYDVVNIRSSRADNYTIFDVSVIE